MTADEADAALRAKGFYLSSVSKMAPELGYLASSRSLKHPSKAENGEGGFGRTPDLAIRALLDIHGAKVRSSNPLADLEAALDELLAVL